MTGCKYIAENGTEITDELVDQWAKEAEEGFPGAQITRFEGCAWTRAAMTDRLSRHVDA